MVTLCNDARVRKMRALKQIAVGRIGVEWGAGRNQASDCRTIRRHRLSQPKRFSRIRNGTGSRRRELTGWLDMANCYCFVFRTNCFTLRTILNLSYGLFRGKFEI
jgi:hypothetical protein